MFNDEIIDRGAVLNPALTEAIRESRMSILLFSKKYASSSWCLDELLEIMKCKENLGQIVMTIFYGVSPSDVRNQTGEFGAAFNETCSKNKEKMSKWSKALTDAGNIAGEDFTKCNNEAKKMEEIAKDVLIRLPAPPSTNSDNMVGLEAHLRKIESLLEFDNDEAKIIAISGPAGIGKTSIAGALRNQLSNRFHYKGFMDLRKSDDEEVLLSKLLKVNHISEFNPGLIKERLRHHKVLIILDDVQSLNQLEALADIGCYGPGSRVIVTTKNKEILQGHGICDIYDVSFPSEDEALMIFCLTAFGETSPPNGFLDIVKEIVTICGNLPLGLKVLGSSLKGKDLDRWNLELQKLTKSLHGDIESVLKLSYESLTEQNLKLIFLCIAVFFRDKPVDYVISIMDEPDWDIRVGLKNLADRYLIQCVNGRVEMHRLLELMARQVNSSQDLSKRKILVNHREITYVLEKSRGNGEVVGISFDIPGLNKIILSSTAFDNMFNLFFLKVYDIPEKNQIHILKDMEFSPYLRLVDWKGYPGKNLLGFCPQNLVELNMCSSKLEKLWEGTQPLANLKKIDVSDSTSLKELPNLSKATNLEKLYLTGCKALVNIPSSIANLHKLRQLPMQRCESLEIIPSLANLTSLEDHINFNGCSKLRTFPDFPTNLFSLYLNGTGVKESPASLRHCSGLWALEMKGSRNLRTFSTHLPTGLCRLELNNSGIESITDCIKCLPNLEYLDLSGCKRLMLLPELPSSLHFLKAGNCEYLKRVSVPLNTPNANLRFTNCSQLNSEARQAIIQQSYFPVKEWIYNCQTSWGILPGIEVPEEFVHRSTINSLTIPPSTFNRVKGCILISPKLLQDIFLPRSGGEFDHLYFDCKINGNLVRRICIYHKDTIQMEHLLIFCSDFLSFNPSEVSTTIVLKCRVPFYDDDQKEEKIKEYPLYMIKWGIQILTDKKELSSTWEFGKDYYSEEQRRRSKLQILEDMELSDRIMFVQWEGYPGKSLPHGFCTENLVKLNLRYSLLEKLWEGTQPLANLMEIDVSFSTRLKKLPDLSTATNLEILNVSCCSALVKIPSSIANLHKLRQLPMQRCESLEIIPSLANLTSLEDHISFNGCSKLRTFPDFPTNQTWLYLNETGVKELPASLRHCSGLWALEMKGSSNLRTFSTHLPTSIRRLELSNSGIESITDCIKCLPNLKYLDLSGCKRLVLLPELPSSLHFLKAENCESLKRVSVPNTPIANLRFTNCFKLDSQARRAIIKQSYFTNREWAGSGRSGWVILPGREVPEEFIHRSTRNSLTIPPSAFNRVKGCILISPKLLQDIFCLRSGSEYDSVYFDCKINGNLVQSIEIYYEDTIQAEHLIIFSSDFLSFDPSTVSTNLVLGCRVYLGFFHKECRSYPLDIIEWGIQILMDEKDLSTTWD